MKLKVAFNTGLEIHVLQRVGFHQRCAACRGFAHVGRAGLGFELML